jgi:hypothetical protein
MRRWSPHPRASRRWLPQLQGGQVWARAAARYTLGSEMLGRAGGSRTARAHGCDPNTRYTRHLYRRAKHARPFPTRLARPGPRRCAGPGGRERRTSASAASPGGWLAGARACGGSLRAAPPLRLRYSATCHVAASVVSSRFRLQSIFRAQQEPFCRESEAPARQTGAAQISSIAPVASLGPGLLEKTGRCKERKGFAAPSQVRAIRRARPLRHANRVQSPGIACMCRRTQVTLIITITLC